MAAYRYFEAVMCLILRERSQRGRVAMNLYTSRMLRSVLLFVLAGLAEIGGGYLVWLWLREGRPVWVGGLGMLVLILYGVLPTLQPPDFDFARTYAAYGGLFIVLSLAWGQMVEHRTPDAPSLWGGALALIGAAIIAYWPR